MGFLNKLFGKQEESKIEIAAPVAGEAVPVAEVNDPTFSEEILGKGIAIRPTGHEVVAPCDGTVEMMFDTGHAVSLTSRDGAEILIHIGLETVKLKGTHYTTHAGSGDQVQKGQKLISFDLEGIAADGYDTITPIVICNSDSFTQVECRTGKVDAGDTILVLSK